MQKFLKTKTMKKSLLIFFIISCFVSVVQAQNTDWEITPFQPGFLDGYDIDSGSFHVIMDSSYYYVHDGSSGTGLRQNYYNVHTFYDSTPTGITIYGIAISTFPFSNDYDPVTIDTSTSNWQEFTCIYKPIGDSMILVAKAPYNQFARPDYVLPARKTYWDIRYVRPEYIIYNDSLNPLSRNSVIVSPVFETYFDTAVYITDSFYVGTTMECNTAVVENRHFMGRKALFVDMSALVNYEAYHTYMPRPRIDMDHKIMDNHYDPVNRWERFEYPYYDAFILCFPILSPEPGRNVPVDTVLNYFDTTQVDTTHIDTTQVDTTHSGIAAGLLERYINVYPTVADGGTVTVLSSFHLEGVEVFDAAGRMLSRQPASGVATTVDVSQLPAGSYVLRVNTVSGSTTKKFLKR